VVLGLSGSYKNATTFTWERLSEARDARERIVHLLVNGEKWLQEYQADGPETWDEQDHSNLVRSYGSWHRGYAALLDDLNGSHYVDIMLQLIDAGTEYLTDNQSSLNVRGSKSPMQFILRTVTCRAGLHSHCALVNAAYKSDLATVVDRERKVIDMLVDLRLDVRTGVQSAWDDQHNVRGFLKQLSLC
jgi:cysteinyl-tRNA synthetase